MDGGVEVGDGEEATMVPEKAKKRYMVVPIYSPN